jgi:hypothetical protein
MTSTTAPQPARPPTPGRATARVHDDERVRRRAEHGRSYDGDFPHDLVDARRAQDASAVPTETTWMPGNVTVPPARMPSGVHPAAAVERG